MKLFCANVYRKVDESVLDGYGVAAANIVAVAAADIQIIYIVTAVATDIVL